MRKTVWNKRPLTLLGTFALATSTFAGCIDQLDADPSDPATADVAGPERTYVRTVHGILPVDAEERADGSIVIQGDIVISARELAGNLIAPEDLEAALAQDPVEGTRAAVRSVGSSRWPGGAMPFRLGATLSTVQRQAATDAIAHWANVTPFTFVAYNATVHNDWVEFVPGADNAACRSQIGRQGGRQEIEVSVCDWPRVAHEIGHAVGFFHEQSRADRDTFVTINTANITPTRLHNFDKYLARADQADGQDLGLYDFGSLMHYEADAFSSNTLDTITPKVALPAGTVMGQRNALSMQDRYAAFALFTGANMDGPPYSGGPVVSVYREPNYGNTAQKQMFLPGVYTAGTPNMLSVVGDNQISSVIVPPGLVAQVCDGIGGVGTSTCNLLTTSTPQLLPTIDNKVSYVKVSRAVTAYRDANRTGVSQTFAVGEYRANAGQLNVVGNDQITSLVVPAGLVVELCTSESATVCGTYEGNVNMVSATLQDQTSFIRVKPAVTLYQESRLWGNQKSLTPGTYYVQLTNPFSPVANNSVSSLVVGEGLMAVVCDSTLGTTCETYRGTTTYVGEDMNDKASYIRVMANTRP